MSEGTGVGKRILRLKGEDGQALVEFAFVLPLILLFLFAIIDFGLALNTQNTETNLANLAARNVSVMTSATLTCGSSPEANVQAWVQCTAAGEGINTTSLSACITTTGTYTSGNPITVKVSKPFSWTGIIGGLGGYLGSLATTISSSATMRIEQTSTTSTTFVTSSLC